MRAMVIRAHGGPEVLEPADLPDPAPGAGEVVVRVRACALNHLDLWTRAGLPGLKVPFPHVLGSDIAGEIEAVGATVDEGAETVDRAPTGLRMDGESLRPGHGIQPGQRVMLSPGLSCGACPMCARGEDTFCRSGAGYRILGHQVHGGYAELVRCPAVNAIPLPDGIGFEEAAAFPLVFLTAWRLLVTRARLRAGEDVLVWAAGSGVGMAAVQLAKVLGARVIATAGSDAKLEQARRLGADEAVNHYAADVVAEVKRLTGKKGADVVVEHVGQATWERSILSLARGGRLVTCGATTGPHGATDLRHLFARQLSLLGSYMGSKAELVEAAALLFARKVKTVVHAALPLDEARRAHEMMDRSEHFGKIVLRV